MPQTEVETKLLTLRLTGECFGIRCVAKKYIKFGAVGAVLDEKGHKSIVWSCQMLP